MNTPSDGSFGEALKTLDLVVNGRPVAVASTRAACRLSDVLRDDLGLTGTKVGCSAGDCGACTVLLDGEQVCACLVAGAQCAGRSVETVESLAAPATGALSPLQQAFIDHGAAQCGICTPGMLMAAADTLRRHPHPTEQQVLDGLGGVLCRCTGYRKIVEAVMSVGQAQVRAAGLPIGSVAAGRAVGARVERFDARAKVTGAEQFGADQAPADALWLRTIRSPHPRARFVFGDLAAWIAARPGLVAAITSDAIPNNRFAIFPDLRDQPALAEGEVRFAGEAIAVVAGTRAAIDALDDASFPVTWDILPPVSGVAAGLAPGAPSVQ
jgi:aerobic-type carbon monoxide dehydrogenase small subunit (CoxS/CutS family)